MIDRKFSIMIPIIFLIGMLVGCGGIETIQPLSPGQTPTMQSTQQVAVPVTPAPGNHPMEMQMRAKDGMRMVYIPSGTFKMGSTEAQVEAALALCREHYSICNRWYYQREIPQHSVSLAAFWMDQTEITNAQYQLCVQDGICTKPLACKKGEPTFDDPEKADHPVVCVSWEDAQNYCQWAGARLPTEAQ